MKQSGISVHRKGLWVDRPVILMVLSMKVAVLMDGMASLVALSTEWAVFVDKSLWLLLLSTKRRLP